MQEHFERHQEGLLYRILKEERREGSRILHDENGAVAFVPVCARYPYEIWIAPERRVSWLGDLGAGERRGLARALRTALQKLDGLWNRAMPYLMVLYQAPLDGPEYAHAHAHFQIYPAYRTKDRLKFLAGTELGGGMFVNDSLPEEKAAELRAVKVGP